MLNIVLFGPPGAGKGTQSVKLVKKYKLVHLSTGDIFRQNMAQETELGLLAKEYMCKGNLVPDNVTINMLQAEVEKHPNAYGFIFDGFPRTIAQAESLDIFLNTKKTDVKLMLALEVSEEELVKRLLKRGEESGRADDADKEIIINRIKVYHEQTAVAAGYYAKQNKYFPINGVGSLEKIFNSLCKVMNRFI